MFPYVVNYFPFQCTALCLMLVHPLVALDCTSIEPIDDTNLQDLLDFGLISVV